MCHGHAQGLQFFSRTNARAQKNFGRVQSTSAQDGFFRIKLIDATLTPYFHARDSVTVHNYALDLGVGDDGDRKSTRLNSSHVAISYAVFCLKKKKKY